MEGICHMCKSVYPSHDAFGGLIILRELEEKRKSEWWTAMRETSECVRSVYFTRARNRASSGGWMGVVHGRRGGCRWTGVGSFICRLLEEIVLQGVEWRDAAFRVIVQHAQDQVWKRTNMTMSMMMMDIFCSSYRTQGLKMLSTQTWVFLKTKVFLWVPHHANNV